MHVMELPYGDLVHRVRDEGDACSYIHPEIRVRG